MSKSKADLFLELAQPNDKGVSREVSADEFVGRYEGLILGNGGSWCRDDSPLGRKYKIERIKNSGRMGNPITAVALRGFNDEKIGKHIPPRISRVIKKERCVVLGTSKPEVDHKDGSRKNPRHNDPKQLTVDDFQPLSKAANDAKRQICKDCQKTKKRFDAKRLGYRVSQVHGDGTYRGTCVGCYWHDVIYFNSEVSKPRNK